MITNHEMKIADNGVNVAALLAAREHLREMPEAARFTWRAECDWIGGVHSRSTMHGFFGLGEEQTHIRSFTIEANHPPQFAAEDNGPTPVEIVLSALASCLSAGVAAVAQNRGITLRSIRAIVEGDMDIAGILGIDADVRNGFSEIRLRFVTLAVGAHTRVPRTHRGGDIMFWMERLGLFDLAYTEVDDIERVRRTPSMQLMGDPEGGSVDLNALQDIGVEIAGRPAGIADDRAQFSGSLANVCAAADLKLGRLLDAIDAWIETHDFDELVAAPDRPAPTRLPAKPRLALDFVREGVTSVVWATGYKPDHGFLDLPVIDAKGRIRHDGGVVASGLYVMGLPFLRRRKSLHIDGAGADARDPAGHLEVCLAARVAA